MSENRFLKRLSTGKPLVLAEGYIFELERKGYLSAGPFCPEILLERPEVIKAVTQDFIRCGSEVIVACTYYINRPKLEIIGKPGQDVLYETNRIALQIAREVQQEPGNEHCLISGDLSNLPNFRLDDPQCAQEALEMFTEQAQWALEGGVDFIIAETINSYQEASLALKAIKLTGLPALINLTAFIDGKTRDNLPLEEAFQKLKAEGADVVGINCSFGPKTILPYLEKLRKAVDGPIAGVPVPYRCTEGEQEKFYSLKDSTVDVAPFPTALEPFYCNRYEIAEFAKQAWAIGVQVIGVCCGNTPSFTRQLAEALGQQTQLSKYSPQMEKHYFLGKSEDKEQLNWGKRLNQTSI